MERPGNVESAHRGLDRRHAPRSSAAVGKHPVGVRALELLPYQPPKAVRPLADFVLAVLRLPDLDAVYRDLIAPDRAQVFLPEAGQVGGPEQSSKRYMRLAERQAQFFVRNRPCPGFLGVSPDAVARVYVAGANPHPVVENAR